MNVQRPIPPHAARKLAEIAPDIVRHIDDAVAAGHPADSTLASHFRAHRELGSRDRRFLSNLVFSYFRWRGWTRNMDFKDALILSCRLDGTEIHPAIAILADNSDLQPLARLSLDQKSAEVDGLRIEYLVPPWFREVLYEPDIHLNKCIEAFQKRPPTWLRIATGHEQNVLHALDQAGIQTRRHEKIAQAVAVMGSSNLQSLTSMNVEIQDLASQCVGLLCDPKPGEWWWDVCAGSGGKTLHLADLMANKGSILATDVRDSALEELRRRAKKASAGIVRIGNLDPVQRKFDGVLIDAPCAGIGTWSRNPDARWRTSVDDVRARAKFQAELLRESAEKVRPGGRLVYAVCTITITETVDVIDAFLHERSDFALEEALHPITKRTGQGTFWIWPWDGPCDGMFVARMRRSWN